VSVYIVTAVERFPGEESQEHHQVFNNIKRATTYYESMRKSASWSVQFYIIEKELTYPEIMLLNKLEDV